MPASRSTPQQYLLLHKETGLYVEAMTWFRVNLTRRKSDAMPFATPAVAIAYRVAVKTAMDLVVVSA